MEGYDSLMWTCLTWGIRAIFAIILVFIGLALFGFIKGIVIGAIEGLSDIKNGRSTITNQPPKLNLGDYTFLHDEDGHLAPKDNEKEE